MHTTNKPLAEKAFESKINTVLTKDQSLTHSIKNQQEKSTMVMQPNNDMKTLGEVLANLARG